MNKQFNFSKIKNPLATLPELLVRTTRKKVEGTIISDLNNNRESDFHGYIDIRTKCDELEFTKLIISPKFHHSVLGLASRAHTVFFWISLNLKYANDTIVIKVESLRRDTALSSNTIGLAIKDLIAAQIICRIGKKKNHPDYNLYYINPHVIFKGIRYKFYQKQSQVEDVH